MDRLIAYEGAIEKKKEEIRAELAKLEREGKAIAEKITPIKEQLEQMHNSYRALSHAGETLQKELREVSTLSSKVSEVEAAAARLEGLNAAIEELKRRTSELNAQASEEQDRLMIRSMELDDQISALESRIDHETPRKMDETTRHISETKAEIKDLDTARGETQKKLAGIEAQLFELSKIEAQINEHQEQRSRMIQESSEWSYIQAACSKDGLRALEIDSVAPTISAYANDLLSRTFGPLFSVRFRTQNEDGREVLDILAIREDGTEALIENLSGGERVWILKALRLAMTLVSKEKSGRLFGTCLADEEDGALDAENGQNFIRLYRSFMETGGFGSMYYISHKPEAIGLADRILMFGEGGIEIQ